MRQLVIASLLFCATACGPQRSGEVDQPEPPPALSFDGADYKDKAARLAHGKRLVSVLGCAGCHGKKLTGMNFTADEPEYGIFYASNLTRVMPDYSDAEFERLLRAGEHPRRSQLWLMPSEIFQHLGDADMSALTVYLRSLPPTGKPTPPPQLGPLAHEEIASGKTKSAAQWVKETKAQLPLDLGPAHSRARYIAQVTCAECHGPKLEGHDTTPDLITAGAYSRDEFERLITQGVPTGNRKLKPLMVDVAQNRFTKLTPQERDALYAYLKARAQQPQ